MVRIIHISDIHFGASLKGSSYAKDFATLRQHEIKDTFVRAVKYASENADFLLITGDLFETEFLKKTDMDLVQRVLSECKCNVLIIAGNHDPLTINTFWDSVYLPQNVFVFQDELSVISFPEFNIDFYGYSWSKYYIEDDVFKSIEIKDQSKINVLLAHGEIGSKKSKYLPIDKNNIMNAGFEYVALGHIHKHQFITENIVYPGSLEPFDFKETGPHGLIQIAVSKTSFTATFMPFSKREFVLKEVTVLPEDGQEDIISKINLLDAKERRENNLYRIILKGSYRSDTSLNFDNIHEICKREFFYLELQNELKLDIDITLLYEENKENIIGKFIEYFQAQDLDDEVIKNAFELGLEKLLLSKEGLL